MNFLWQLNTKLYTVPRSHPLFWIKTLGYFILSLKLLETVSNSLVEKCSAERNTITEKDTSSSTSTSKQTLMLKASILLCRSIQELQEKNLLLLHLRKWAKIKQSTCTLIVSRKIRNWQYRVYIFFTILIFVYLTRTATPSPDLPFVVVSIFWIHDILLNRGNCRHVFIEYMNFIEFYRI